MEKIYFDHAATTPLDFEVLEKMLPFLTECFGNPDSPHGIGRMAMNAVDEARDKVAALIGAKATGKSNYIGVLINEIKKKMVGPFNCIFNLNVSEESKYFYEQYYYKPIQRKAGNQAKKKGSAARKASSIARECGWCAQFDHLPQDDLL